MGEVAAIKEIAHVHWIDGRVPYKMGGDKEGTPVTMIAIGVALRNSRMQLLCGRLRSRGEIVVFVRDMTVRHIIYLGLIATAYAAAFWLAPDDQFMPFAILALAGIYLCACYGQPVSMRGKR